MDHPSVGIGILNWNGRIHLEQFLHFFYSVTYPNKCIYVIDNASTDDSLEYIRQQHPAVKIIETGTNYGFAGGYNKGFAQMPEKYLLMVNSDVEVTPGFLEPLVQLLESDEKVAVVQPKILSFYDRTKFEHAGAAGGMIDVLGYSLCRGRIFDSVETDINQFENANIFWASGACSLIRKTTYEEIGGMYDYLFMHFEEIDMCWRLQARGYKIVYCSNAVVYHVGGATLTYQSPQKTYYNFRNNLIIVYRNSPVKYRIFWLPIRLAMDQLAFLHYLFTGQTKNAFAVWRGYCGFFKWIFDKHGFVPVKVSLLDIPETIKTSIVLTYYVAGKKTFYAVSKSKKLNG